MKNVEIKLVRDHDDVHVSFYSEEGLNHQTGISICGGVLQKLFYIPKNQKEITLVLSKKRDAFSHKVMRKHHNLVFLDPYSRCSSEYVLRQTRIQWRKRYLDWYRPETEFFISIKL